MDAAIVVGAVVGLMILVTLAFVIGSMAKKKGYSYAGFWFFGFFLWLPALIVALKLPNRNREYPPVYFGPQCPPEGAQTPTCPYCGAALPGDGVFCTTCGARIR